MKQDANLSSAERLSRLPGFSTAAAIKALGRKRKADKRLANESYREARHAPKPADVKKKWTQAEIKECFGDTEEIAAAYFPTLFPPTTGSEPQSS